MSEPLTSHEIEDVLSSIRRLVSEDLRPARAAMAAAQAAPTDLPDEADKLLLTPALRVVPAAEKPFDPAPEVEAVVPPKDPVDELTAPADELPAAEAVAAEAELSLVEAETDDTLFAEPVAAFPGREELYDDAGLDEGDLLQADNRLRMGEDDVLWAAAGEYEAPAQEEVLTPAPETMAPPVHGHWTAQDVPGMDWAQEETEWSETEAGPVPFVAHPRKPDLTADPLARAWADRAEAAVRAELDETIAAAVIPPTADAEPLEPADSSGLFDGGAEGIDEEMLRDIVRDIIREELAGTLGERITRNVRKLVRVEINRALAAREFE